MKYFITFILLFILNSSLYAQEGITLIWTGEVSTAWDTATNWDVGVKPTVDDKVFIPSGTTFSPTLSSSATCRQLTVESGATLNGSNGKLTIQSYLDSEGILGYNEPGFFTVETGGVFNYGTSTVTLKPQFDSEDANVTVNGVRNFYHLTIQGVDATAVTKITGSGNFNVYANFIFAGGVLEFNTSDKFIIGGNFLNNLASNTGVSYSNFGQIEMKGTWIPTPAQTTGWRLEGPKTAGDYINAEVVIDVGSAIMDSVTVFGRALFAKTLTVKTGKLSTMNLTTSYAVSLGNSSVPGNMTVNSGAIARIANNLSIYTGSLAVEGTMYSGKNSLSPTISLIAGNGGTAGSATINGILNLFNSSIFSAENGSSNISGSGTINANAGTIKIGRYFDFSGTFNAGTSTVGFYSASQSRIADNKQFYNLTFNKTNSTDIIRPVSLGSVISFTNNLVFTSGYFYQGGLKAIKTGITSFDINNYCAITLAGSGNVTVTKFTQTTPPGGPNAIQNYLVVSNATQNISTIKTYYESGGGNDELSSGFSNSGGNLRTWRSINSGSSWTKIGGTDDGNAATSPSSAGLSSNTNYYAFMDNNSSSLPVEFDSTYFYAKSVADGIELSWLTHSEENLKGFVMYRSTEPDGVFTEVDSWVTNDKLRSSNDGYSTSDSYYLYTNIGLNLGKTYYYRVKAYCSEEDQGYHPKTVSATYEETSLSGLDQNYPNPFNSQTTIRYIVGNDLPVSLVVFNSNGQIIKQLVNCNQKKGVYTVSLNSNDIASGMYFYRLKVGNQTL